MRSQSSLDLMRNIPGKESFFIKNIWIIPDAILNETDTLGEYDVKISNRLFGFYLPYHFRSPSTYRGMLTPRDSHLPLRIFDMPTIGLCAEPLTNSSGSGRISILAGWLNSRFSGSCARIPVVSYWLVGSMACLCCGRWIVYLCKIIFFRFPTYIAYSVTYWLGATLKLYLVMCIYNCIFLLWFPDRAMRRAGHPSKIPSLE